MDYYILKKRLAAALWLLSLLEIVLVVACWYFHGQALDGAPENDRFSFVKLACWLNGIAWLGFLLVYFFGSRHLGAAMESWQHGRTTTMRDGTPQAQIQAPGRNSWFSGMFSIIGLFVLIAGLGVAFFMYHARHPSMFEIVEHGTVKEMDAALSTTPDPVNEKNKDGKSLLMVAIESGRRDMVNELLSADVDVNAVDRTGRPALELAINQPDLIEQLLQKGADVNLVDSGGMAPLHWAIRRHCKDAVRLLLQYGAHINQRNQDGNTPLLMAVKGQCPVVDLLLMHGADPNMADQIGDTPLHVAAANDDLEVARSLITAGAEVAPVSRQGWTPLHVAALKGALPVVALLLQSNVDANLANKRSQTAITCAILGKHPKVVSYLLDHGADIDRLDRQGNTYLHLALEQQQYDIATLLLQDGANIDIPNDAGLTARQLIRSCGREKMLKIGMATASK